MRKVLRFTGLLAIALLANLALGAPQARADQTWDFKGHVYLDQNGGPDKGDIMTMTITWKYTYLGRTVWVSSDFHPITNINGDFTLSGVKFPDSTSYIEASITNSTNHALDIGGTGDSVDDVNPNGTINLSDSYVFNP